MHVRGLASLLPLAVFVVVAVAALRRRRTTVEYLNLGMAAVAVLVVAVPVISGSFLNLCVVLGVWGVLFAVRQHHVARARNNTGNDAGTSAADRA